MDFGVFAVPVIGPDSPWREYWHDSAGLILIWIAVICVSGIVLVLWDARRKRSRRFANRNAKPS